MKFSFSVLYSGDIPLVNICLSVEARIIWMVVEKAVASHEHHGADAEHNLGSILAPLLYRYSVNHISSVSISTFMFIFHRLSLDDGLSSADVLNGL